MNLVLVFASIAAMLLVGQLVLADPTVVDEDEDNYDSDDGDDDDGDDYDVDGYDPYYFEMTSPEERVSYGGQRIEQLLITSNDAEYLEKVQNIKDLANYSEDKCTPEALDKIQLALESLDIDGHLLSDFILFHIDHQLELCELDINKSESNIDKLNLLRQNVDQVKAARSALPL